MSQVRKRSRDANSACEMVDVELTDSASRQHRAPRKAFLVLAVLLTILSTIMLLVYIQAGSRIPFALGLNKSQTGSTSEENLFRLHPEAHSFRQPTTIRQIWHITSGLRRPDGVLKRVYLINGKSPGPTVEARSGDRILIRVKNELQDEEVSIHWHGLSMRGSNDIDGAVGITNAPITPGTAMTYNFSIDNGQSGTFFYHSHDSIQRAEGCYGAFIAHKPATQADTEISRSNHILLMISDWYHRPAKEAFDFYMHPGSFGLEAVPDSVLLNGDGAFNCSNAVAARPLECEQRSVHGLPFLHLHGSMRNVLHIINVGAYAGFSISASDAVLTAVAVDGGNAINGRPAKSLGYVQPGQRVQVVVEPSENTTREMPALQVSLDSTPFKYPNPALTLTHSFPVRWTAVKSGVAEHALDKFDLSNAKSSKNQESLLSGNPDRTIVLYTMTQRLAHLENIPRGFINHTSWTPQSPPLISLSRNLWDKNQLVPQIRYEPQTPLWVDIILNNLDEESHPFHLHGYDFWVLSTYSSTFNWGSYNPFEQSKQPPGGAYDLAGAVKRDTVTVPRRGYVVLRFRADNPGLWMFHCHVLWHMASGMAMAFEVS